MAIFSDKNVVLSNDFKDSAYDLNALYVKKPSTRPTNMSAELYAAWPFTDAASSTLNGQGTRNGQYQYGAAPSANSVMELNVAFIVGDDASSNKGIHTILSYLQPFNSTADILRMRGSIIGIYKSRHFNAPAGSFYDYYVAPQRTFGYSSLLKGGKMPPASPTISSYRRMRQFVVSPADYAALKAIPIPNDKATDDDKRVTVDTWLNVVNKKY